MSTTQPHSQHSFMLAEHPGAQGEPSHSGVEQAPAPAASVQAAELQAAQTAHAAHAVQVVQAAHAAHAAHAAQVAQAAELQAAQTVHAAHAAQVAQAARAAHAAHTAHVAQAMQAAQAAQAGAKAFQERNLVARPVQPDGGGGISFAELEDLVGLGSSSSSSSSSPYLHSSRAGVTSHGTAAAIANAGKMGRSRLYESEEILGENDAEAEDTAAENMFVRRIYNTKMANDAVEAVALKMAANISEYHHRIEGYTKEKYPDAQVSGNRDTTHVYTHSFVIE